MAFWQEYESILGEELSTMESEADDHEEPVGNPLVQGFQGIMSAVAASQTAAKQTPLDEYLIAHAEELAQAEKRWKDASVDEWKAGAQGKFIRGANCAVV
jgi:hypothetical protein